MYPITVLWEDTIVAVTLWELCSCVPVRCPVRGQMLFRVFVCIRYAGLGVIVLHSGCDALGTHNVDRALGWVCCFDRLCARRWTTWRLVSTWTRGDSLTADMYVHTYVLWSLKRDKSVPISFLVGGFSCI